MNISRKCYLKVNRDNLKLDVISHYTFKIVSWDLDVLGIKKIQTVIDEIENSLIKEFGNDIV